MNPKYTGEGIGKGVVILRIKEDTPFKERQLLEKARGAMAKANSSKSRIYRRNWSEYHRQKRLFS